MSPKFFVLTTLVLIAALLLLSFWQDRRATRRSAPPGRMHETKEGVIHLLSRGPKDSGQLPVVLLHGSFTNALDMDIDLAKALGGDRQILMPDRPGHGFSPRGPDSFRLDVQVAAMREAVRKEGAERYVVSGQSYGAAAALVWALAYPEEVAGLVLVAPVSHPWPYGVRWYIKAATHPLYGWLFRRTFIALYARYRARHGVERALLGCKAAPYYYERTRVDLTFRADEFRSNAEDICRLYEQLVPLAARYQDIAVPTEIVAGTHDMTVILPIHGGKLAETIPDCNLDVVEGGGHALHHSHPEVILEAFSRVDARLEMKARSPLESALRAIGAVFPQRVADKQEAQTR